MSCQLIAVCLPEEFQDKVRQLSFKGAWKLQTCQRQGDRLGDAFIPSGPVTRLEAGGAGGVISSEKEETE